MGKKEKVYSLQAFRYGITNGFSTLITTIAATYFSLFLTSGVGLDTTSMATIITASGLGDLFSLLIVSVIMQKAHFKSGKFRPWLIIGGIGAALFMWLSFTPVAFTGSAKAIWYGVSYVLMYAMFNLAYSAFTGILPLMAKTPSERVSFASARVMCNSIGKFLFSLTSVSLIAAFGGKGNEARGYSLFALLIAILVIFGFVQLFFGTKDVDVVKVENVGENGEKKKDQYDVSLWEMIKYTVSKPFLLYVLGATCKGSMYFIIAGLASYYYKYVVGNMNMLTVYLSAGTFLMICGSFVTPFVSKFLKGSRNTYVIGIALYGLCLGSAFILGRNAVSFTVLMCLGYIGYALAHASEVAVYSAIVDYSKWKSGKDLKPFMMTLFSLTPKIGTTVGNAILGFGLVAVGFSTNNVTPQAVNGIRILISALPAIISAVGVIAMLIFPLSNKKAIEINEELARRDLEAANNSAE